MPKTRTCTAKSTNNFQFGYDQDRSRKSAIVKKWITAFIQRNMPSIDYRWIFFPFEKLAKSTSN